MTLAIFSFIVRGTHSKTKEVCDDKRWTNPTKEKIHQRIQYRFKQRSRGCPVEVINLDGYKFKIELVDPRKQTVRVIGVGNDIYKEPCEGNITTTRGRISCLTAYASLPIPKDTTYAIMIEKLCRL